MRPRRALPTLPTGRQARRRDCKKTYETPEDSKRKDDEVPKDREIPEFVEISNQKKSAIEITLFVLPLYSIKHATYY
jgi:hypothetical protein